MSAFQDVAPCDLRQGNCCFHPLPWRWSQKRPFHLYTKLHGVVEYNTGLLMHISRKNVKKMDYLKELVVDGKIIFNLILNMWELTMWNSLLWLRTWTVSGSFWTRQLVGKCKVVAVFN